MKFSRILVILTTLLFSHSSFAGYSICQYSMSMWMSDNNRSCINLWSEHNHLRGLSHTKVHGDADLLYISRPHDNAKNQDLKNAIVEIFERCPLPEKMDESLISCYSSATKIPGISTETDDGKQSVVGE